KARARPGEAPPPLLPCALVDLRRLALRAHEASPIPLHRRCNAGATITSCCVTSIEVIARSSFRYVYLRYVMERNNPFKFGALALDEAFTDREDELAELGA